MYWKTRKREKDCRRSRSKVKPISVRFWVIEFTNEQVLRAEVSKLQKKRTGRKMNRSRASRLISR